MSLSMQNGYVSVRVSESILYGVCLCMYMCVLSLVTYCVCLYDCIVDCLFCLYQCMSVVES